MSSAPRLLGKYEVLERLGKGGMAEVRKALDTQLMRVVAIKFLPEHMRTQPGFLDRFIREGQAVASLNHPNIVKVFDLHVASSEEENPEDYMVMDYIDGPTLADYIRQNSHIGQFPTPSEIVRLFASISLAIDYAHQHTVNQHGIIHNGVIHRDIKPANILLDSHKTGLNPMGEPILTDFGIVKILGAETLTAAGTSLGTPLYMSPEIVQGQEGTSKSDIYSLGIVLYEICTGTPPFLGDTPYAIMLQHIQNTATPASYINPRIPAEVDQVIAHCLAKNPNERFNKASSMTVALAQAFGVPIPNQLKGTIAALATDPQAGNSNDSNLRDYLQIPDSLEDMIQKRRQRTAAERAKKPPTSQPVVSSQYAPTLIPAAQPIPMLVAHQTTLPTKNKQLPPPIAVPTKKTGSQTRRHRTRFWPLIAIATICLILGPILFEKFSMISPSGAAQNVVVGSVSFHNSGQLTDTKYPGINDEIVMHLNNPPQLAANKQYYAWLQDNKTEPASILLGPLVINQGIASLPQAYIDPQHQNLLATKSKVLITEEDKNITPNTPTVDTNLWLYEGKIPDKASPQDAEGFSQLDHLRHLLSSEPTLTKLGMTGGIDTWFLKDSEQIRNEAAIIGDPNQQDKVVLRQSLTNILYYLDGNKCAQAEVQPHHFLPQTVTKIVSDSNAVGLRDCIQQPDIPGHLTHIGRHLNGIVQSLGVTNEQKQRAIGINKSLNVMTSGLSKIHADVMALADMTSTQLGADKTQRRNLLMDTQNTLDGQMNPQTNILERGAKQICDDIELLASFDVTAYKQHG